ncbi:MAG: hypothetical protein ABIS36_19185 [Chryseolinea sp.]
MTEGLKAKVADVNPYREEGKVAKAIESQTSKIPSDAFLWTGGGLMIASLTLKLLKKNQSALFIGQWVAPVLLMGLYNKIVKIQGHDQLDNTPT